ncbi:MAG: tRNA (adenosine(37)-N6)-dimethylallyltransferase MiaA [Gemmatimonas sp.]
MTDALGASDTVPVIMGPTGAGKSAIAMHLAERYGLAIVSADSRQIYRGFDIGTAKPVEAERQRIPHFGIDILDPTVRYSAHQWSTDADGWIAQARVQGRQPLIVGGTGFYVRALVDPLDPTPDLDPTRRAALASWLNMLDADALARWCRRLDPARASLGRTQQLRAVETALLAGRRISDWPTAETIDPQPPGRVARYLVVDPGVVLHRRIAQRVDAMVAAGWFDEVRALSAHVPSEAPAWNASGYGRIREAVSGERSRESAVERVIIETRQYAKRQRTWCRHQLPIAHVTRVDSNAPDALAQACAWWESVEGSQT